MNSWSRFFRIIFICLLLLASIVAARLLLTSGGIETGLLALLPVTQQDKVVEDASVEYTGQMGRRVVFLIETSKLSSATAAAKTISSALQRRPDLFVDITGRVRDDLMRDYYDTFFPYRWQVLSRENARRLSQRGESEIVNDALDTLYAPVSGPATSLLNDDPLFLFSDFMRHLPRLTSQFTLEEGYLVAQVKDKKVVMVTAATASNSFAPVEAASAFTVIDNACKKVVQTDSNVRIDWTGMLKFANDSASSAKREVSIIGVGTLLGIFVLFLVAFRSPALLLVGALPFAAGLVLAFSLTGLIFGSVHMLTLVFGASLTGVCVDYSLHYFTHLGYHGGEDRQRVLRHIFPGITLGMLTSVAGYMCLLVAPFPGLAQMAVFSSAGLIGAYLTVVLLFPVLPPEAVYGSPVLFRMVSSTLHSLRTPIAGKLVSAGLFLLVALSLVGISKLRFNDDIRLLRNQNASLFAEESRMAELLGAYDKSRFVLVEGKDEDELMAREQRVVDVLRRLEKKQVLNNHLALSEIIPSSAVQRLNGRRMRALAVSPEANAYGELLGSKTLFASLEQAPFAQNRFLRVTDIIDRPSMAPFRILWIGNTSRGVASAVMLDTLRDAGMLVSELEPLPFATYVDRVGSISGLFKEYRWISSWLVAAAYLAILIFLMIRYRPRAGIRVFAPTFITALLLLGAMGFLGAQANLFTFLALFITLGICIDYSIFFAEAPQNAPSTGVAIVLSALTTLLSFGLLSLSSTPALSAFGFTILFGVISAVLLSPIALRPPSNSKGEEHSC